MRYEVPFRVNAPDLARLDAIVIQAENEDRAKETVMALAALIGGEVTPIRDPRAPIITPRGELQ